MKLQFFSNETDPGRARIEFHPESDDEILFIKKLPGWFYYKPGAWSHNKEGFFVVPISIGLAMTLEELGEYPSLLAVVQEQEKALLYSLTAPAPQMGIYQMDRIKTDEAISAAYQNHYWRDHRGNAREYIKNHPETLQTPEVKPGQRRKKTEREVKDRQIKEGRVD